MVVGGLQGIMLWLDFNLALFTSIFASGWLVAQAWSGRRPLSWRNDINLLSSLAVTSLIATFVTTFMCQITVWFAFRPARCDRLDFGQSLPLHIYPLFLTGVLFWVCYRFWIWSLLRRTRSH